MREYIKRTLLENKHSALDRSYLFLAFSITLMPFMASLGLGVFIAVNLYALFQAGKPLSRLYPGSLLLSAPFLIFALMLVIPTDYEEAGAYLVRILPVLVVPGFIALNFNKLSLSKKDLNTWYLAGLVGALAIALISGCYHAMVRGWSADHFMYYNLAGYLSLHPSYLSLFVLYGLVAVSGMSLKTSVRWGWILVFLLVLILLQTRMAWLLFALWVVWELFKRFSLKQGAVLTLSGLLMIFLAFRSVPRLQELAPDFSGEDTELIGNVGENGVSQRIWLWKNAVRKSGENGFHGYGLRSQRNLFKWQMQQETLKREVSFQYSKAVNEVASWNLHNQYLQVLYEGGWVFLLFFVLWILWVFMKSIKVKGSRDFTMVFVMFLCFLLTENMLDRQMGIYFYAFILPMAFCFENCGNEK